MKITGIKFLTLQKKSNFCNLSPPFCGVTGLCAVPQDSKDEKEQVYTVKQPGLKD